MARPVVALLTDFGTRDHYAGTMKGVVLGIAPDAALVDITHDLPAHDIVGGALELAACYRYFPAGTIFLVVVDPGVGSARRGLAAEAGGYRFVAPDNGVLSLALAEEPPRLVVELAAPQYALPVISRTFEGRDRFAPAAAWLATGVDLAALGPPIADYRRLTLAEPVVTPDGLSGEVRRIDRFGNAVTNIGRQDVERLAAGGEVLVAAGGHEVGGLVATYEEGRGAAACALFGSTGHLEIASAGASAAERLGLTRGSAVRIRRGP